MLRNRVPVRPAMIRPVTVRRGTVMTEIKVCQELIRLAAERTRVLQEHRMWAQKRQALDGQLEALDRYREDLLDRLGHRLGLERPRPPRPGGREQEGSEGQGSPGVMELRY